MLEEFPVAGAQVVQSGFAVVSMCKAVFIPTGTISAEMAGR